MENNFLMLREKLLKIINKGFICMNEHKYTNAGLLLEKELGIETNDFSVPDIYGIEIKAINKFNSTPLTLFSCSCDGPDLFEIQRLVNRFGAKDYEYNGAKVLYINLCTSKFTSWGRYLKMKLHIDKKQRRIYIIVANSNEKIIEKRSFWDFETLNGVMLRKLNYLCIVDFKNIYRNNIRFCHFSGFKFYQYKNFDAFLSELDKGNISISIKYGVYKRGHKIGSSYNHGTAFIIKKESISNLFNDIPF